MLTLRRTDRAKNMARFYTVDLGQDLFGRAWLLRRWGRQGSNGRVRYDFFADKGEAMRALKRLIQTKRRRGYRVREGRKSLASPSPA